MSQKARGFSHWLAVLWKILHFRLARKLFLIVIAAIVLMELIIVIPSYNSFKQQQLDSYREIARVASQTALAELADDSPDISTRLLDIKRSDERILGVSLLDIEGNLRAGSGETIDFRPGPRDPEKFRISADNRNYDVFFDASEIGSPYHVLVRMDIAQIAVDLNAYLFRILGLVLLVCIGSGAIGSEQERSQRGFFFGFD